MLDDVSESFSGSIVDFGSASNLLLMLRANFDARRFDLYELRPDDVPSESWTVAGILSSLV